MSRTFRYDPFTQKAEARDGSVWWTEGGPRWARNMWLTRPCRRMNKRLCRQAARETPADDAAWPHGNGKPNELFYRL